MRRNERELITVGAAEEKLTGYKHTHTHRMCLCVRVYICVHTVYMC